MRCIEILYDWLKVLQTQPININMRCIEMRKSYYEYEEDYD